VSATYNLELHNLLIEHDGFDFLQFSLRDESYKVNSDRVEEILIERIFLKKKWLE
jgi:chemotaxis signal transduction protein